MRSKKKVASNLSKLFSIDFFNISNDFSQQHSSQLYTELTRLSTNEEKCLAIERVVNSLTKSIEDPIQVGQVTKILFVALLQLNKQALLRKKIIVSLSLICEEFKRIYYLSIEEALKLELMSNTKFEVLLNVMEIMAERKELILPELSEDYKESLIFNQEIFPLISEMCSDNMKLLWGKAKDIKTSSAETNLNFQAILQITKKFSTLLQNKSKYSINISVAVNSTMLLTLLEIVASDITPLDLRTSCGMLSILLNVTEKDSFILFEEVLDKSGSFECLEDMGQMSLFHGLLCHVEGKQLFSPIPCSTSQTNDLDLCTKMLEKLSNMINTAQIAPVTVLGSRILNHLMTRLLEVVANNDILSGNNIHLKYSVHSNNAKKIIDILWLLWDHFLDSVKHIARETFIIFIKIQDHVNRNDAISYFTKLGNSLAQSLSRKQSFSALTCLVPFIGTSSLLETYPGLVISLLKMLSDPAYATHSSNLIEALFNKHHSEAGYEDWHQFWFNSFFENFSKEMLTYGYEALLEKLLFVSKDETKSVASLVSTTHLNDHKLCLLIMCAKICLKSKKWTRRESQPDSSSSELWKGVIPFHFLEVSLESGDETLAILAFNLLCESSKSTELYNEIELHTLMDFVRRNIASQDASFKQKFANNVKKALGRISKGIASKVKIFASVEDKSELLKLVKIHEEFIRQLFVFVSSNICSGSNFPRRSSSLMILDLLFEILNDPSFIPMKHELFSLSLKDSLLLCLNDSYETNKQIAMKLLRCVLRDCSFVETKPLNYALVSSVWTMASSSKPPDSLTASYIINVIVNNRFAVLPLESDIPVPMSANKRLVVSWMVLTRLQKETSIAQQSLFKAAASAPMYGLILCLRSLFSNLEKEDLIGNEHQWSDIIEKTICTCLLIANIVSELVKNSSPEGHLPMDLGVDSKILKEAVNSSVAAQENGFKNSLSDFSQEELVKAQAVSAQMLLLCGWRSIKEVSLLFGFLVQGSNSTPNLLDLLSPKNVESMGDFFLVQLTETKHRGAFEQAYSGFGMICNKLWMCKNNELNKLPLIWLNNTLLAIQNESDSRLCATRRSAGVPFIVQAIVSSEPSLKNGVCLKHTMVTLLNIAGSEIELESRIHALNILRSLYRDTRIGEAVIPYVSEGVKVAVDGYKNSSWSVRNSSSLMFAALVNRMLGVKRTQEDLHYKNAVSALVFFRRYPCLYDYFLKNMKQNVEDMKNGDLSPSTFPSLMLLARLAPASSDGYSSSIPLTPFVPFVLAFSSSPVYHLRFLASRALIPLITPLTLVSTVAQLCASISLQDQNHLHGTMLCLTHILKSFTNIIATSEEIKTQIITHLTSVMWVAREVNSCYFTRASCIELFTYVIVKSLNISPMVVKALTASCFSMLLSSPQKMMQIPGGILAVKASTTFFLTVHRKNTKDAIEPLIKLLAFPSPEIRSCVLQYFLSLEEFFEPINRKVIAGIKSKEENVECSRLSFLLLSKIISSIKREDFSLYQNDLNDVLVIILVRFKLKAREELLSAMIQTSGIIIQYKLKSGDELKETIITKWLDSMSQFSDVDFTTDVRLAVAQNVSETLSNLHLAGGFADKMELPLIQIVLDLLVDDDQDIQAIASQHTTQFLRRAQLDYKNFKRVGDEISLPLSTVLEALLFYLASKESEGHFTLLVFHALKEDLSQEFGLSQEDDRAFEKGETKVFREEIHLSRLISNAIRAASAEKGDSYLRSLRLDLGMLAEHLLLPLSSKISTEASDPKRRLCSLPVFATVLMREIEYVLDHFEVLQDSCPFQMRHFDLWVERLARRALLWGALKQGAPQIALEEVLRNNIHGSLMKPRIFELLLECL